MLFVLKAIKKEIEGQGSCVRIHRPSREYDSGRKKSVRAES